MHSKKGFVIPLVIAIVAVLAVGGGYVYYRLNIDCQDCKGGNELKLATTTSNLPSQASTTSVTDITKDWKTYTNTQYGFEIKYPTILNTKYAYFQSEPNVEVLAFGDKNIDNGCYKLYDLGVRETKITIGDIPFCLATGSDVGAGQIYYNYYYTTSKSGNYFTVKYATRTPNGCGAYKNSDDVNSLDNLKYRECSDTLKNYESLIITPIQSSIATFKFTNPTPAPVSTCSCPAGYVLEGEACNPTCYYSTPKCLMPSIMCTPNKIISTTTPVACTMDAMMCPDGTYVGRSAPDCKFVCPLNNLPSITVLSPNGGEIWNQNSEYTISWTYSTAKSSPTIPDKNDEIYIGFRFPDESVCWSNIKSTVGVGSVSITPSKIICEGSSDDRKRVGFVSDLKKGGLFKVQIGVSKYSGGLGIADHSDNYFTIN